jgi:hypothetical protein
MTLRLPKGADIRSTWGTTLPDVYDGCDLVEVPALSGRLYLACTVEQAHAGFANEYRVALIAQIGVGPGGFVSAGGGSAEALVSPGSSAVSSAGGGSAVALVSPGSSAVGSAGGGSAVALVSPGSSTAGVSAGGGSAVALVGAGQSVSSAGGGSAVATTIVPVKAAVSSAGGGSAVASYSPGSTGGTSAGGGSATAVVSSGGGTVTPGASCGAAASISLPFSQSGTIASGNQQWWTFNQTSGTTYHLRMTTVSGSAASGIAWNGTCLTLNNLASVSPVPTACQSWVAASSGQVWIEVQGPLIGSWSYTIEVATGVC